MYNIACYMLLRSSMFSGLFWAAKVSMCFVVNLVKGLRIYVLAQITRRRDFAVKYGGRWAGMEGVNAVCNVIKENCHVAFGL